MAEVRPERARTVAGVASFCLLGAAFGYVMASAYIAFRFQGSLDRIDFLFLARNALTLPEQAPQEALVAAVIIGAFVLVPLALGTFALNEALTTFGQTRWQTEAEMKRNGFLGEPGRGFVLGKLGPPASKRPFLVSRAHPHALLVAPTGRGKGVGFVIPNLLTFKGSVVVLDVKGENFAETSRCRQAMGDRVIRFAPGDWSDKPSHRYNPLARIAALRNPDQQMMELRLTAGLFLQADNDRVSGLLQGGINIFVAAGMLAIERGRPTLGEVYCLAASGGDKRMAYGRLAVHTKHRGAQLLWESLASINDDTLTSYLSLLTTSGLDTWSNPAIDAATAASDFSFRELRREPHAVYLEVAPDMIRPLAPLIRLFFSDLIASLQAREPGPDEPWRVMIMLDEFDRLGRMPIVAESIKTLRSYGAHLALVTQTIPALDEIYGENTRLSLQGGAGVKVYLTPSDQKTTRELSEAVGRTTRRVISKSRPFGPSPLRSRTLTERSEDAPLLSEDEVRTMSLEDVVVVIDAQNPIRARRIKFYEDRTFKPLHKAQMRSKLPYLDQATAKVARLERRVEELEVEKRDGGGGTLGLVAPPPSAPASAPPAAPPAAPAAAAPAGLKAEEVEVSRLLTSERRAQVKAALRDAPRERLGPASVPPDEADCLRSGIVKITRLKHS